MAINPTSQIGMIRLRIADWSDIPILPDSVIQSAIDQNQGNIPRASKLCAQYILGSLTTKVHRKMSLQLEVFGAEWYQNYRDFLVLTVTNPAFMDISPVATSSLVSGGRNVLQDFVNDWNKNYYYGTQSQRLALDADIGPNDGSRYGPLGNLSTVGSDGSVGGSGWVVP